MTKIRIVDHKEIKIDWGKLGTKKPKIFSLLSGYNLSGDPKYLEDIANIYYDCNAKALGNFYKAKYEEQSGKQFERKRMEHEKAPKQAPESLDVGHLVDEFKAWRGSK